MRIPYKSKFHLRSAFRHYLREGYYQFCLDAWYYGEFDFFIDMLGLLQRHYKSEFIRSGTYQHMVEIYYNEKWNPNLHNPNNGEPRPDRYGWALKEEKSFNLSDILK